MQYMDMDYEYLDVGLIETVQTSQSQYDENSLEKYVEEEEVGVGAIPTSTTFSNKLIELGLCIQSDLEKKKDEVQNHEGASKKESMDSNIKDLPADSVIKAKFLKVELSKKCEQLINTDSNKPEVEAQTGEDISQNNQNQRSSQGYNFKDRCGSPSYLNELIKTAPCLRRLLTYGNVTVSKIEENSQMDSRHRPHNKKNYLTITKTGGKTICSPPGNGSIANVNKCCRPTSSNSSPQPNISSLLSNLDWSTYPSVQKLLQLQKLVETKVKETNFGADTRGVVTKPQVPVDLKEKVQVQPPVPVFHVPYLPPTLLPTENSDPLPISVVRPTNLSNDKQKKSEDISKFTPTKFSTFFHSTAPTLKVKPKLVKVSCKRAESLILKPTPSVSRAIPQTKKARVEEMDPTRFLEVSLLEGEDSRATNCVDDRQRKYPCYICSKSFFWTTDLKRHVLTHTGERPFKCLYCSSDFTRKFLKDKHVRKFHPEVGYETMMSPNDREHSLKPKFAVATPSILKSKEYGSPRDNLSIEPVDLTSTDEDYDPMEISGGNSEEKSKEELLETKLTSPMISPGAKDCYDGYKTPKRRFIPTDWYKSPKLKQLFEVDFEKDEELTEERKQRLQDLEEKCPILAKQLGTNNHTVIVL